MMLLSILSRIFWFLHSLGQKKTFSAMQNSDPKAAAVINVLNIYALFLRAIPIRPIKPEPNSHTAAGTGTTPVRTAHP